MKLTDDYHDEKSVNMSLINMALLMSVIVIAILGLVFWMNMPTSKAKNAASNADQEIVTSKYDQMKRDAEASKQVVDELISGSTLTSNDLDIWSLNDSEIAMNKETDNTAVVGAGDGTVSSKSDYQGSLGTQAQSGTQTPLTTSIAEGAIPAGATPESGTTNSIQEIEVVGQAPQDPATDGNHTKVTYTDGTTEWLPLNPNLTVNDYDYTKLIYQKPIMKYYVDGKKTSYFGMDLSKDQGVVDFNKFKKAGGEFVMLKLGGRGYSSGQIVVDEKFADFAKNAKDAGLHVGAYFFSQAANEKEAEEEAKLVTDSLKGYTIKYPVVFRMETIGGDMTRVDDLTQEERTTIAKVFLDKIKGAGYIPMLYGDKEWLLTKYNLADLQDYEIWYAQQEDIPDYPYKFGMWQYTTEGAIDGVAGNIKLDISFKNYAGM